MKASASGDMYAPCVCLGVLIGLTTALVISSVLRYLEPMDYAARGAAVKAGKAEYYLDTNNTRQWHWKP